MVFVCFLLISITIIIKIVSLFITEISIFIIKINLNLNVVFGGRKKDHLAGLGKGGG